MIKTEWSNVMMVGMIPFHRKYERERGMINAIIATFTLGKLTIGRNKTLDWGGLYTYLDIRRHIFNTRSLTMDSRSDRDYGWD